MSVAAETAAQNSADAVDRSEQVISGQPTEDWADVRRILVVDDEIHIVWMLKDALADIPNCQVESAFNGDQALLILAEQSIDLILTDYKMPGMNGLVLTEYIRKISPKTEIMMLTGFGNEHLYREAAKLGIKYVLNKPVKLSKIRQVAKRLLEER